MKKIITFLLVIFLITGGGIGYYIYTKGDKVYPEFKKMEDVKLQHVSLFPPALKVKAITVMHNHNPIGITLSKLEVDVYLNGHKASHVVQRESIQVKPESDFKIPLLVDVPLKKNDAIKNINDILDPIREKKKLPYKIEGKVYFEIAGGEVGIPFEYEDVMDADIKIPKL